MGIHFSAERMEQVFEAHKRWWNGDRSQPLISITLTDVYDAEETTVEPLSQGNCMNLQWSPEAVMDAIDRKLSRQEYLGAAYPIVNFDAFGPGVLAAFCGARLDNSSGNVWFFPEQELELEEIHAKYDPKNPVVQRIKALYRAGLEKWNGSVILGLPDLGGVMDVAATLRGSENLLMDLYDAPEEVMRLNREIQTAWYEAYNDFFELLKPQRYHTCWSGLLSDTPSYITQCDFSYMIGNPMFREFVLDTLREDTLRLDRVIYHLDGIGELKHLDDILALEKLRAVQWVPGAGQPDAEHWLDVYRKISVAGKQIMVCGSAQSCKTVLETLHGSPYILQTIPACDRALAETLLCTR